ncbi:MAG: polysaccharide deacetylase family protein [Fusobacteriaceae bacterium]|jgi:peptidoglycan/xylan/chitin deacetylase (PgdA/CDA1 family)|nr:polysaccharide deacetylase family protein [Fusobacteriaceae bacterium]
MGPMLGLGFMAAATVLAFRGKGVPAFLYHEIAEDEPVTPALFEEHLRLIRQNDLETVFVSDLLDGRIRRKPVLITLDDGYAGYYRSVFPLLEKYNMRATVFLNTAFAGRDPRYLDWAQIQEMDASGRFSFELHSHRHGSVIVSDRIKELDGDRPLFPERGAYSAAGFTVDPVFYERFGAFFANESAGKSKEEALRSAQRWVDIHGKTYFHAVSEAEWTERITADLRENQAEIEKHLGKKADIFCWPWGHGGKFARELLKKMGVRAFVSTKKGTNSRKPDPDCIRRVELRKFTREKFALNLFLCRNLALGKIYGLLS